MPSKMIYTTIQTCLITVISCLIGQAITAYQSDMPFYIDFRQLVQFAAFRLLITPPNLLWQTFLESTFPSTHLVPSNAALAAASQNNEKELDREQKNNKILESKLHIPNTIAKFVLDQTIGSAAITIPFSFMFAKFNDASFDQAVQITKQEFWPLMAAGWKLWPMVSMLNFTVFRSVETRNLVGALAGMVWNVYLSLVTGGGPKIQGK